MIKKCIISMLILLSITTTGCSNKQENLKSITGKVVETKEEPMYRSYCHYVIIKTDSGDIKLQCSLQTYKSLCKDTNIKATYNEDFYIHDYELVKLETESEE